MANVASRLPQAGHEICSSTLLEVLIPQLCKLLDQDDRATLRASSHEVLRLVDCTVSSLELELLEFGSEAVQDGAVAALRRLLARGCRPHTLTLEFPLTPPDAAVKTAFGLRVLAEFGAVASLTSLHLAYLPLTAAVVRAIAAAAPQPSTLRLGNYSLTHCPHSDPDSSDVEALLRHAAPQLQQLHLRDVTSPAGASPLLQCSCLESIELGDYNYVKQPLTFNSGVVSVLAQLPALRSLSLVLPWTQDGGSALTVLSDLTRLTCLSLRGKFDVDATTPALTHLRSLADLRLPMAKLRPLHMRQLAGLTALTRLEVEGIGATDQLSSDGAEPSGGLAAPAMQPKVPMPAQLRELFLTRETSPFEVAALQLPSGLLRLGLQGLKLSPDDKDADGCMREPAAEALLTVCGQLAGRFIDKREQNLAEDTTAPFQLDLCGATAPCSWPDGFGTLFAALRHAAVRELEVYQATLTLYDVDALVRHLPLLEILWLHCGVELPSVPLLCRLERLCELELYPGEAGPAEGWGCELALRAALLGLCADAPSLGLVTFAFAAEPPPDSLQVAVDETIAWLAEELPALHHDPPILQSEW